VLAVGLGLLAERAVDRVLFRRSVSRPVPVEANNFMITVRRAGWRLWYEVLGALVFTVVATIALHLSRLEGATPFCASFCFG
jgi:anti-sigma-K factor RskA